jgi:hypothetical protein
MSRLIAYFFDIPGGGRDNEAHAIFRKAGGHYVGAGTFLATGERDIEYDFSDELSRKRCRTALKNAGFRMKDIDK